MRLPNKYGSVYKLKGRRRNPWVARKTLGWKTGNNGEAQPKYKYIGYYPTRAEALDALALYNNDPVDIESLTLGELHERWRTNHFPSISEASQRQFDYGWTLIEKYQDKPISYFTLQKWQDIFDTSGKNAPSLHVLKVVLGLMYGFGEKFDLIDPRLNKIEHIVNNGTNPNKRERQIFTKEQIQILWDHSKDKRIKYLLILLYSGMRCGELISLTLDDVNIKERYFDVKKAKTAAGIRKVPIADKIFPFVLEFYSTHDKYLICSTTGNQYSNTHFNEDIVRDPTIKLGFRRTSHDCRHTFITMLTEKGVDARIIKQIVGHAGGGVTEQVYTHITMETKLAAVNLL